jgi:CRP/FNR family transcriptional regulator, cyclic AMP receptor protein
VLDADPDLGAAISGDQWDAAAAAALAPAFEFERGPWRFTPPPDRISLGALVITGMLVVQIDAGIRSHAELLGPGDVISPWVGLGDDLATLSSVNASVAARLRIALLDGRFAARTARWPEISAALIQRLIVRSRRLSLQAAINSIPRIDERLELTLWELANRFGRVTRDGIALSLPLTHSQLAGMLAAQRPSVSTALGRLQTHERVVHTGRHTWLLPGEPPQALSSLARQSGLHA